MAGAAADKAGLRDGDVVRQVGTVPVVDGQQLRRLIRASVVNGRTVPATWKIDRAGIELEIIVTPETRQDGELLVGRIGAYVGAMPELVTVRYGAVDGLWRGVTHTWDVSALDAQNDGQDADWRGSLKNLSGPLTIADYAGKSAAHGTDAVLAVPGLDQCQLGGFEFAAAAGSGRWSPDVLSLGRCDGQTGLRMPGWRLCSGAALPSCFFMMSIALFNDITRLFG